MSDEILYRTINQATGEQYASDAQGRRLRHKTNIRLYDLWLAETFGHRYENFLKDREMLMRSRIFMPDREATRYMAEQSVVQASELEHLLRLARLPFNDVWLEDDTYARLERFAELGTLASTFDEDETFKVAYAIRRIGETGWICSPMPDPRVSENRAVVGFSYIVDTERVIGPSLDDEELRAIFPQIAHERANDFLAALALGYHRSPDLSQAKKVLRHIVVQIEDYALEKVRRDPRQADALYGMLHETGGALRYIITLLATINLVETRFEAQEKKLDRLIVGRRSIPYMASTVVRITVPSKPLHKLARAAVAGWKNRAHEVRGHWRKHLDRDSGEIILKWVKEHQRGDASLGYVQHKYQVHHEAGT